MKNIINSNHDSLIEKQKNDLLDLLKIRGRLQNLFKDGSKLLTEDQVGMKERRRCLREFAALITDYNGGFLAGKEQYAVPVIKLPERMYEAAVLLGYKGDDDIIGPWKYIAHVLSQNGVSGMYEEKLDDSVGSIVTYTAGLVRQLVGSTDTQMIKHLNIDLEELLRLVGGDLRGKSLANLSDDGYRKMNFLLTRIQNVIVKSPSDYPNETKILKLVTKMIASLKED